MNRRRSPAALAPSRAEAPARHLRPATADAQEQEAERVAHRIMAGAPPCSVCGGAPGHVQAKAHAGGVRSAAVPAAAASAASAASAGGSGSGGAALSGGLRGFFEPRLGADLGDVRVHTGAAAAQSAQALNARAYTVGADLHFGAGQYQPDTQPGRHLIAHELTHVLQQRQGGPQRVQRFSWNDVLDFVDPDPQHVCQRDIEEAEDWARSGPYPAEPATQITNAGGGMGIGGFDAQYVPDPAEGNGVLRILQGVAVTFKDTLVVTGGVVAPNPDLPASGLTGSTTTTALAARMNSIADPAARAAAVSAYQWTPAEKAPWIARLEPLIEQSWGGQHEFFLNQPRWDWLGATAAVDLTVGERPRGATDHLDLSTFKTPAGESLNTFGIDHVTTDGTLASGFDQTMRLASASVDPNSFDLLRRSVRFNTGSADLTPVATAALDGFIATFNGANAAAAHQEVRVDVIGHTSASGEEAANQRLSEQRTAAVREYLRSHGFANVATRVIEEGRGESDADASDPRRAADQRVDLIVDGGERQIVAIHEFGHSFGLDDEYGTVGTAPDQDATWRPMTDASGAALPGTVREHNGGIMSFGNEIRARHYATFHHALESVTAKSPWSLGPHKAKWQVRMECGDPSPPGDWNPPGPADREQTA